MEATWKSKNGVGLSAETNRVVETVLLEELMRLSISGETSSQVNAIASLKLETLQQWLSQRGKGERAYEEKAHFLHAADRLKRFLEDPESYELPKPIRPPAGSPIGMACACGFLGSDEWIGVSE